MTLSNIYNKKHLKLHIIKVYIEFNTIYTSYFALFIKIILITCLIQGVMRMKQVYIFTLVSVIFTFLTSSSNAQNKNIEQDIKSPFLQEFAITSMPIGHSQFCNVYKSDCSYQSDKVYRMRLSPHRWEQLLQVNYQANNSITPRTDMEIYAVKEYWTYPSSQGDCEDYALLKRKRLIDLGWHPSTLRITVVLDEKNEGHAVLTASTDRGDMILDNVRDEILLWKDVDYTYIKRQSGFDAKTWVSLRSTPIYPDNMPSTSF